MDPPVLSSNPIANPNPNPKPKLYPDPDANPNRNPNPNPNPRLLHEWTCESFITWPSETSHGATGANSHQEGPIHGK